MRMFLSFKFSTALPILKTYFLFFKVFMASSSHYHYHNDDDDDEFETLFEEFFEIPDIIPEPKERKNAFLSRETGKMAT